MSFGFLVLPCWQKELPHFHHRGNHRHAVRLKTAPGSEASFLPAKGGCSVALLCCPQGGSPIGTLCQIERGNGLKKPPQSGTCLLYILLSFDTFWAPNQTPWPPPVPTQHPPNPVLPVQPSSPCGRKSDWRGPSAPSGGGWILGIISILNYIPHIHWSLRWVPLTTLGSSVQMVTKPLSFALDWKSTNTVFILLKLWIRIFILLVLFCFLFAEVIKLQNFYSDIASFLALGKLEG